ncbi:TPA: endonuclease domain-containing protein [Pseudomonas aeruginosa]|uniref:endonuclease domain-containing protein n=1 Tax=Pseudomonas aeruginosa TaxID=287 RepID=UPI00307CBA0F
MWQRQTEAERALWRCLRGHRLLGLKFRRQKVLGPYIVDFVCHEQMLVIELDGGQHVGSPADAWLESRGPGCCGSGTTRCWRAGRCCWRSFSCCRRFLSRNRLAEFKSRFSCSASIPM